MIDEAVAGRGVAEGGPGEVGQEQCDGAVVGRAGHAVQAHREGGGRVVGLQVGAGDEDLADQGAGLGLVGQVRAGVPPAPSRPGRRSS